MNVQFGHNTFVISINAERLKAFRAVLRERGLEQPALYEGCYCKNGVLGCTLSHYSLIKLAKTLGLPYLIVLEDDAYPRKDCKEHLDKLFEHLPDDWRILKLEDLWHEKYQVVDDSNPYWFKGISFAGGSGSAAYILHHDSYDSIINAYEFYNFQIPADVVLNLKDLQDGFYVAKDLAFLQSNMTDSDSIHDNIKFEDKIWQNYKKIEDFI